MALLFCRAWTPMDTTARKLLLVEMDPVKREALLRPSADPKNDAPLDVEVCNGIGLKKCKSLLANGDFQAPAFITQTDLMLLARCAPRCHDTLCRWSVTPKRPGS